MTGKFTELEKEQWCVEDENDIQVNRVIEELLPSAIPSVVMIKETRDDPELAQLREDLTQGKRCRKELSSFRGVFDELSCIDGFILRGQKLVIPKSLQTDVIGLGHECHLGGEKTVKLIRETRWFPKMSQMVDEYVKTCKGCLAAIKKHASSTS